MTAHSRALQKLYSPKNPYAVGGISQAADVHTTTLGSLLSKINSKRVRECSSHTTGEDASAAAKGDRNGGGQRMTWVAARAGLLPMFACQPGIWGSDGRTPSTSRQAGLQLTGAPRHSRQLRLAHGGQTASAHAVTEALPKAGVRPAREPLAHRFPVVAGNLGPGLALRKDPQHGRHKRAIADGLRLRRLRRQVITQNFPFGVGESRQGGLERHRAWLASHLR